MQINISESGDYCLTDPKAAELTRYGSETGPAVTITPVQGGEPQTISWGGAQKSTPWPSSLAIKDGATYLVDQVDKDSRTMVVLHMVEDTAPTDAHRAVFMAEKGCGEQAKMLLALLKKAR